ncbi:MAG: FtsX-like permease family protein [Leptolyngbyaceae cyanobacterium MO_188.B28]|nr:FtsX-like permease family protein [Leptolyngbyaceae cyanobacterium MO_188.B28]
MKLTVAVSNRPLWRLAWKRLRQRPLQYILCILGIALGVAMMVSIDLANGSAQRAFSLSTDAITGRATHRIVAVTPKGVDTSVYRDLRRQLGQIPAAPIVEGYVLADELGSQPMHLVGIDLFAEGPFVNYFGDLAGQTGFVQFLTEPNAVMLSETVAKQYQLGLGDSLRLDIAGRRRTAQLIGSLTPSNRLNQTALSTIMFADIATAQELLGQPDSVGYIDLIVDDPDDVEAIKDLLPSGVKLETAAAQKNAVQQMTAAFELNLTALSLLALVVGMFLIYNTVTFSVIQRRPIFGVLRCLGVTQGQLFALIVGEAAIFSVIGSILGVGLGVVLGHSIVGLIAQTINDFYFVVTVQQITLAKSTLVKGLAVGVAAALLASSIPALEAMGVSPQMTLQRSTLESKVQRLLPFLALAWGVFLVLGVGLLRWRTGGLIAAFGGLFAILLGTVLLTPSLISLFLKTWEPLSHRLLGVVGGLAPRNILRSLSRTSVAIAALMVSVSVIVGVSIMVGSFRTTVVSWLDQTLQADIYVSPPQSTANRVFGKVDPDIVSALETWPGVNQAVTYNDADVRVVDFDRQAKVISAGGDVSQGKRPYAWIRPDLTDPFEALQPESGVIISEALILRQNLPDIPQTITLETLVGDRSFPVLAVFYDYSSDQGSVIIDHDLYATLWRDTSVASVGLFVDPAADVEAIVNDIRQSFKGRQNLSVQSNRSLRQGSLEIFDRTFAITNALRLLAVVVAFIGVLSTLMSLQLERTRELGILRATGMTPQQLGRLTLLETGLMGSLAGIFAMPLGFVLAWILIYVINVRSFGWTLNMALEARYFWQAFLVSVLAAVLAGLYPAIRLGRMNISAAVREE